MTKISHHENYIFNEKLETVTQLKVYKHLIAGMSRGEIAKKLFVSNSTVCHYARQIYKLIGVNSQIELIADYHANI